MLDNVEWLLITLLVVLGVLVLLPPSWDPAIRLKEWNERRRR
jgi:hypothetical protein